LYENAGRVYLVLEGTRDFKLIYDFASKEGHYFELYDHADQIDFDIIQATIKKRFTLINDHYKGPCYTVILKKPWGDTIFQDVEETWMGGVGSQYLPLDNCALRYGDNNMLMSCTVGDEVLYYNRNIIDGVTPDPSEVKKNTIDFTHVVKSQPRIRRRSAGQNYENIDQQLTGEYSQNVLCLEFKTLTETYTVSVATADGQVIYQKRVCSGSLLALDIDISDFTPGDYVCSVANAAETFWAPFSLYASAVHVVHDAASSTALFDLSGRRLIQRPSNGIYIENGQKRVARGKE
jgi:hypothetical protein